MKKLLVLALFLPLPLFAQSFALNEASGNYASTGIGVNIGGQDYYSSYILKNTAMINPGMQPPIVDAIVNVSSGSATTFSDGNPYANYAVNQFTGGTYEVICAGNQFSGGIQKCSGGAFGRTGTITSNTATGGGGTTWTVGSGTSFAPEDTIIVHGPRTPSSTMNDFSNFGWTTGGTVAVDSTSGDLPAADASGYNVVQVAKVTGTGSMTTAFDTSAQQYYAYNGTYSIGINYKVLTGSSCPISYSVHRSVTSGVNASGTITTVADGAWHYNATASFTASEPNTLASNPNVQITYTGASGCVTLWFGSQLIRTSDTNASVYSDHLLLADYAGIVKPAEIRYWAGQYGETLDNWIATQNYRSDSMATVSNLSGVQQGLYDFLNMAVLQNIKAVEIVVPYTFDATTFSNIVDFISGGSGTTYGAKRIALGTAAGFNTLIPRIVLEVGNEPWNSAAGGQAVPLYSPCASTSGSCWNYMGIATAFCGAMKGNANWDGTHMFCAAGIQGGNFFLSLTQQIDTAHNIDIYAVNQYTIQGPTACTATNLFQTWWQQAWQSTHDASDSQGWYQAAVQAATQPNGTAYPYEYQNNLGSGSCTQAQVNGQAEGLGESLADVLAPAWDQQVFGTKDATFFTTYQPNFGISTSGGATSNNIWGIFTGAGGAYQNPRVSAQALGMFNNCANGRTGYAATGTAIPTFNFTGINGLNSETGVPTVFALPFLSGSNRCIALFNMDPTTTRTISFTGTNIPIGTVTKVLLSSPNVTDNNEGANAALAVQPATTTVTNPASFTLAPHSMMTISWSTGVIPPDSVTMSGTLSISGNVVIP